MVPGGPHLVQELEKVGWRQFRADFHYCDVCWKLIEKDLEMWPASPLYSELRVYFPGQMVPLETRVLNTLCRESLPADMIRRLSDDHLMDLRNIGVAGLRVIRARFGRTA